jgi:hypothetical protein
VVGKKIRRAQKACENSTPSARTTFCSGSNLTGVIWHSQPWNQPCAAVLAPARFADTDRLPADVHLWFALPRVPASWLQSQTTAHITALAKAMVFQRQKVRAINVPTSLICLSRPPADNSAASAVRSVRCTRRCARSTTRWLPTTAPSARCSSGRQALGFLRIQGCAHCSRAIRRRTFNLTVGHALNTVPTYFKTTRRRDERLICILAGVLHFDAGDQFGETRIAVKRY